MASIAGELLGSLPVLADTPPRKKDGVAKEFDVHGVGQRTSMSKGMASPQDNIEDRPKKARKTRAPRDPDADVSGEVCKNYLAGRCKFGGDCRRIHEGDDIPQDNVGGKKPHEKKERKPRAPRDPDADVSGEICQNYIAGRCKFGYDCRRIHSSDHHVEGRSYSFSGAVLDVQASRGPGDVEQAALASPPRLISGGEVKAVLNGKPELFLDKACSARLLGQRYGWDNFGSGPLFEAMEESVDADAQLRGIAEAPELAQEVAKAMQESAPNLEYFPIVGSSECERGGEVIIIASPGEDPKAACLRALLFIINLILKVCQNE